MKTRTLNKAAILTAIGVTIGTSQAANILLNGSFESTGTAITPDTIGAAWGDTAAAADLNNWSITQATTVIGLANGGSGPIFDTGNGSTVPRLNPTDGNTFITTSANGIATLTQTLSGLGSGNIVVSLDWVAQIAAAGGSGSIQLEIFEGTNDTGVSLFNETMTDTDGSQDVWHSESFSAFSSTSSELYVRLTLTDGLSGGQLGVDNISMDFTAVPEPSSMALLGLSGLGLLLRRKRSN